MRHFRPIWTLALFLLLWATAAPQAFASWTCDGRVCSTGWSCCCVLPATSGDGNCRSAASSTGPGSGAVCPASCACIATVQSWDANRASAAPVIHAPAFDPALLPVPPAVLGPLPTEFVAHSHGRRGPPLTAVHLATPVLRGPPALTSPFIGS